MRILIAYVYEDHAGNIHNVLPSMAYAAEQRGWTPRGASYDVV